MQPPKTKHLYLICDYALGDLAFAEIVASLADKGIDGVLPWATAANPFDTVSTGFVLAQLSCRSFTHPANVFMFANCAPRQDLSHARPNNEGEGLLYFALTNGVKGLSTNSGYSLSFIKPFIAELWSTHAETGGSQFRSRDFFPQYVVKMIASEHKSFLVHQLVVADVVPDYPVGIVGYVDSFGNIKTTYRSGDEAVDRLKPGDNINVTIGKVSLLATVSGGNFGVPQGGLSFAPGSSGYDRPFWELFYRGGSAYRLFHMPETGAEISIGHNET